MNVWSGWPRKLFCRSRGRCPVCRLESRDATARRPKPDAHQGFLAWSREHYLPEPLKMTLLALNNRAQKIVPAAQILPRPRRHRGPAQPRCPPAHQPTVPVSTASASSPNAAPPRLARTVAKTSAGASEHVRIARVTNLRPLARADGAEEANVWVLGLDERGTPDYADFDFRADCVLVAWPRRRRPPRPRQKTCDSPPPRIHHWPAWSPRSTSQ